MIGTTDEIKRMLVTEDRDKVWEIKEYHPKRSLNANSYAWVLISKIADALRANK